jgi:hypothetical protein
MPSKLAASTAQAFVVTNRSIHDEDPARLARPGPREERVHRQRRHTFVKVGENLKENHVKGSAYRFHFLGYKVVVVVDRKLKGIHDVLAPSPLVPMSKRPIWK